MACLLVLATSGTAMAADSLRLINTCLSHLQDVEHASDRHDKVTLSDSCPELSFVLGSPDFAQLEPALQDETSLAQLREVQLSLLSLQAVPGHQRSPDLNNLKQILKNTYTPEKKSRPIENPVDKLLEWIGKKLKEYFEHDNWLTRHFHVDSKPGKNTIKGIFNVIVVLLVVIVLFIVVNELRAASLFSLLRHRRSKRRHPGRQALHRHDSQAVTLSDISGLPATLQVPALLRYTLQRLIDRRVLPRRLNLTNREFLGILRQNLPEAGQDFELLVNSSERVLYGQKSIAAADTQRLLERARHIERIEGEYKS